MRMTSLAVAAMTVLAGCGGPGSDPGPSPDYLEWREGCAAAPALGNFNPATDFFIANFDIKTDVDDLHAAAALATMLSAGEFACVDYMAVHGAYGTQEGNFIPAPRLFDMAFGDNWRDAHEARAATVKELGRKMADVLEAGGDVWIEDAGQSDVSAGIVRAAMKRNPDLAYGEKVHVVQHSDWNEEVTTPADLEFVRTKTDYIRIADGNGGGNGTPNYRTADGAAWDILLADEIVGPVWAEAQRIANANNGGENYLNEAIAAGGLDFSDTVEAAHVFGYNEVGDVEAFAAYFTQRN